MKLVMTKIIDVCVCECSTYADLSIDIKMYIQYSYNKMPP